MTFSCSNLVYYIVCTLGNELMNTFLSIVRCNAKLAYKPSPFWLHGCRQGSCARSNLLICSNEGLTPEISTFYSKKGLIFFCKPRNRHHSGLSTYPLVQYHFRLPAQVNYFGTVIIIIIIVVIIVVDVIIFIVIIILVNTDSFFIFLLASIIVYFLWWPLALNLKTNIKVNSCFATAAVCGRIVAELPFTYLWWESKQKQLRKFLSPFSSIHYWR